MLSRPPSPWNCTVRGCGLALAARGPSGAGGALACDRGHSFDRARAGYVNLLQPGDRRSRAAGDRPEASLARERLERRGVGDRLRARVAERVLGSFAAQGRGPVIAELGCGSGALLAALQEAFAGGAAALGIDLSVSGVERAARRFPGVEFAVANADRRLPLGDGSVDVLVSVQGPKQPAEFARVLAPTGRLLVAVPGPRDLLELRAAVLGEGREVNRAAAAIESFALVFRVEATESVEEHHALAGSELADALEASYRGARRGERERLAELEELQVTFAWDLVWMLPRSGA